MTPKLRRKGPIWYVRSKNSERRLKPGAPNPKSGKVAQVSPASGDKNGKETDNAEEI